MSPEQKERIDDLQRGGCRIIQRPELFCFGMDAVLLSAWAQVKSADRVLDLCSGNGIVPILMDARLPEKLRREGSIRFTGVEINPVCVDLARRSALMNGQSERICFLEGDIREICSVGTAHETSDGSFAGAAYETSDGRSADTAAGIPDAVCAGIAPGTFDVVTVNPPYMTGDGGLKGPSPERAIARHEVLCTMEDTARAAARALRQGGHLYMVHRPHRLGDIFQALEKYGLGVGRMRMVHPFSDKEANLVLIDARKGGKMYVHVEAPLIVYRETGVYTEELKALYG